ncbi:hypothetical protein ISN45_Aa05g028440 [Arabidopsis thaliana x Arabidopsis arenosa]|uniref:Uncharacterized protein n=1 Tax=Arabidopsis thaliana x Arabidopsis arenosa TaxID=1240361 RepID=A0A8T1ZQW7_9BRAS|nr:hypothetical protein ISN45_Aa05g028440 [Arabidopsis thaliana x Arabidopsis arenosa]
MLVNWLAEKPNKKISKLQKAIDMLNDTLNYIAKYEKYFLDQAAIDREKASKFGECFKSSYLESMKWCEEIAKEFADKMPPLLEELVLMESLKKREIEALRERDGALTTAQKTRRFCFFF